MILNTGSRTDIPAYYSNWFYNRIRDGYVLVRNPYYRNEVMEYKLNPEVVDCLVFCTKNPEPMIPRLDEIESFGQFWFVTITPYDLDIEPFVPPVEKVIESFKKLSLKVGVEKIVWRYDPIFITEKYTVDKHIETFNKIAAQLAGYTQECIISFIDLYEKTKRNFKGVNQVSKQDRHTLARSFIKIGEEKNIRIKTCAEGNELSVYGVDCSGCMTKPVIERAIGTSLKIPKKKSAREGCECLLGNDIGEYNTCGHGCLYCYANYDRNTVKINMRNHDPNSPFLIGGMLDGDIVKTAKQESFIDGQISMF